MKREFLSQHCRSVITLVCAAIVVLTAPAARADVITICVGPGCISNPGQTLTGDELPVQILLAYSPQETTDSLSWTLTASGGVIIDAWEGNASVPIPGTNPQIYWIFQSAATGLGAPGATVSGNKANEYFMGPQYPGMTVELGTLTVSAIAPGMLTFDGTYTVAMTPPPAGGPFTRHDTVLEVIPEPGTALLLGSGLFALAMRHRSAATGGARDPDRGAGGPSSG